MIVTTEPLFDGDSDFGLVGDESEGSGEERLWAWPFHRCRLDPRRLPIKLFKQQHLPPPCVPDLCGAKVIWLLPAGSNTVSFNSGQLQNT